jgi:hypothetical protein
VATIGGILTLIVFVALATTLVVHPESVQLVTAGGNAFSQSIEAATGGNPKTS